MAQTCPHGFAPADCLICEALGRAKQSTATKTRPAAGRRKGAAAPGRVAPSEVLAPGDRGGRGRRSAGGSLALVAIGVVVAIIAVIGLAGLVFSLLHILGLVLGALIAGWIGYQIGHFRGSRGH